jgi:hypothetical protein
MATPTFQGTVRHINDVEFEIYAYRPLTTEEIDREIALFVISQRRAIRAGKHRIFSALGALGD